MVASAISGTRVGADSLQVLHQKLIFAFDALLPGFTRHSGACAADRSRRIYRTI
jgi:hypothetical protein